MQDVNYELIYESGKDGADPMDYLSRHPLKQTERVDTEKTIKALISNEHGIVMKSKRTNSTGQTDSHTGEAAKTGHNCCS